MSKRGGFEVTPEQIVESSKPRPRTKRRLPMAKKPPLPPWMYKHDATVPMNILCDARFTTTHRLAVAILCGFAWGKSDEAFPSQRNLAAYLGVSERQTRVILECLDAGRILRKETKDQRKYPRVKGKAGLVYRLLHKARTPV